MDRKALLWNGWGEANQPDPLPDDAPLWPRLAAALGVDVFPQTPAVTLDEIGLAEPRLTQSQRQALVGIVGAGGVCVDHYERAFHAFGSSYYDLLRARAGELRGAPDAVVYPSTPEQTLTVVQYCAQQRIALIPFGGGSSVVGGVNGDADAPQTQITLDTTRMCELLEVDTQSMRATARCGIYGPALEQALAAHGVTLGHYPQSFQYSTLGGWIAARGAGQQSNRYGKAEEWLAAARLATPSGMWDTCSAPASAAGPDLRQWVAGSEGTLGVICEATFKVRALPAQRDYRGYLVRDFSSGVALIRQLNHAQIPTAMMRVSDPDETFFMQMASASEAAGGMGEALKAAYLRLRGFPARPCLLLIGVEGEAALVAWSVGRIKRICRKAGALSLGTSTGERWFANRFNMPFLRDPLLDRGVGVDTLETATDWARLPALYAQVREAIDTALQANRAAPKAQHIVMAHVSHSYQDGASVYFTFVFLRNAQDAVAQWQAVKRAACDAIVQAGGTVSHHHGVGLDHAPWLSCDQGALGLTLLSAGKRALDPEGIMNPRKLLPARRV